ncbi:MAG: hypothetical protein EHM45_24455, partial [Desulfobacteraceae bacterium]
MKARLIIITVMFITFLLAPGAVSNALAEQPGGAVKAGEKEAKAAPQAVDMEQLGKLSLTRHSITLNGKVIRYNAETGYMV